MGVDVTDARKFNYAFASDLFPFPLFVYALFFSESLLFLCTCCCCQLSVRLFMYCSGTTCHQRRLSLSFFTLLTSAFFITRNCGLSILLLSLLYSVFIAYLTYALVLVSYFIGYKLSFAFVNVCNKMPLCHCVVKNKLKR